MAFSSFDKRLLEAGLAYFEKPRLTCLLEERDRPRGRSER